MSAAPAYAAVAVPTITALSVAVGSTAGGYNILVTGTGFSTVSEDPDDAAIKFGTGTSAPSSAAILVLSDTQLALKVPAGTGAANTGLVDIFITNSGGPSIASAKSKWAYRAPITATVPDNTLLNPVAGSSITVGVAFTDSYALTGSTNFALEKITATVGGAAAVVTYVDNTHVKVVVPAGTPSATATKVALFHDTVAGTADSANAKYAAVITSLSRTSGPIAGGGGSITVTGKGLTGATSWKFGASSATCAVTASSDVQATCTVIPKSPLNDGATTVTVTDLPTTVSVTFTPATSIPFGYTAGGAYTYTNVS